MEELFGSGKISNGQVSVIEVEVSIENHQGGKEHFTEGMFKVTFMHS